MLNLDALESAARAATPGPWNVFYKHKYDEWHVSLPEPNSSMRLALWRGGCPTRNPQADATHIAACDPATILTLCKIARAAVGYMRLRSEREPNCANVDAFAQWCEDMSQAHADLMAALRDGGLID